MDPNKVHEKVLETVLRVQCQVERERSELKQAIAEARVDIEEDAWNQHSRIAIFLALKDLQMRMYGEYLIINKEDEEI